MLMILGLFWGSGKNCFEGLGKHIAADAHDAGLVFSVKENPLQLMLMMLPPF